MTERNCKKTYSYEEALEFSKKNTLVQAKKIYIDAKKNRIKKENEMINKINSEMEFSFLGLKQVNYV
jgi:hypothetical protein